MTDRILILDFGSQYTQLIARRVRELNVFCVIHPYNHLPATLDNVKGVILSGSPCSVHDDGHPEIDLNLFHMVPVLGVCYGAQLMSFQMGGKIMPSETREYGRARLSDIDHHSPLFKEVELDSQVWMSHGDTISSLQDEAQIIASTETVSVAAYQINGSDRYGIQFHPEVTHTKEGKTILRNFVVHICGCRQDWTPDIFVESTIDSIRKKIGQDKVVLGLSGGVDSSVAATLVNHAIGNQLHCIFVDNGLLRKNEFENVLNSYQNLGLHVTGVDSRSRFYSALKGKSEPEEKRKAIGKTFIEVFDEEAGKIKDVAWLA